MAIHTMCDMVGLIIKWEEKLNAFYDMMEEYLTDSRSREVACMLQKEQLKTLMMLKKIDVKDYKPCEYIKNVPDYHSEEIIPHFEIAADSSPYKVFETILMYEEKLEEFYTHMRDVLMYRNSKELFDMLVMFKMGQIKKIKACMDSCDLVV